MDETPWYRKWFWRGLGLLVLGILLSQPAMYFGVQGPARPFRPPTVLPDSTALVGEIILLVGPLTALVGAATALVSATAALVNACRRLKRAWKGPPPRKRKAAPRISE